jgi:septum formation protein
MENWNSIDRTVILASGSPRRRDLLSQMGVEFRVEVDAIDDEERFFRQYPTEEALKKLARAKAKGVAEKHPEALVIGADTIVVSKGKVLGKPIDREDARAMISEYSGATHSVFTCVSIESIAANFHETIISETEVTFRNLQDWEIDNYLDTAHYQDKAGAYGIQDEAMLFVESVSGCYTNVVGFPISSVIALLERYQQNQIGESR